MMKPPSFPLAALILVALLLSSPAHAGGGPQNVAVVVNADSWASLAVANHYVALRKIPAGNVVYLRDLPGNLSIGVEEFRQRILRPVLEKLERRGLAGQIDCIAYSADLPYAIHVAADVEKQKLPRMITPEASINGLTYLYEPVLAKNPEYLSLTVNHYLRRRAGSAREVPWSAAVREKLSQAHKLVRGKKWSEALPLLQDMAAANPDSARVLYDLACCLARLGKNDPAMATLEKAVAAGWTDVWHAQKDEDLASLRGRDEFKKLLERMEKTDFQVQPTRGFRNDIAWSDGLESVEPIKGRRYLLCTMLAMTSGRGNSVREALDGLTRGAAADGACPKGTIYYLRNGDIRSTTRQWGFASAARQLKRLGVAAEVLEGVLPNGRPDVAGCMIGAAGFDWKKCGSNILPGAICEHLTSCGGIMHEDGGQTPLSELIRYGAAGASGTVTEPYAIQNKFPTPFLHFFYAQGCSLAEAFYQAVHGPYQLLIVGDPLCRPWARIPQAAIDGVAAGATLRGAVTLRPRQLGSWALGRWEWFLDGKRFRAVGRDEPVSLDTATLADGYHEIRLVGVTADPIETQGHAIVPVAVSNRGLVVEAKASAAKVGLDQSVSVEVKMAGAKAIVLEQNGRRLATIAGPSGRAEIPASQLGLGSVAIQPIGLLSGISAPNAPGRSDEPEAISGLLRAADMCVGTPVRLEIIPPQPLPALSQRPPRLLPGLLLTRPGQSSVIVEQTKDGDWLSKHVKPGQEFVLEGYFDVAAEEVYQFQLQATIHVETLVDGHALTQPAGNGLKYLPVSLDAGAHRLTVKGRGAEKATFDLFFGGPGARRIAADRFRHAP